MSKPSKETHFVYLDTLMVHVKFKDYVTSGSEEKAFTIYGGGGHLGHAIYINFCSRFQSRYHIIFGFNWLSGLRGEDDGRQRTAII